jgi:hypothetical protein
MGSRRREENQGGGWSVEEIGGGWRRVEDEGGGDWRRMEEDGGGWRRMVSSLFYYIKRKLEGKVQLPKQNPKI